MCRRICIYICTYIHIHIYTHVYVYTYGCLNVCVYTYTHISVCNLLVQIQMRMYIHINMYVSEKVICVYIYIYVCIYAVKNMFVIGIVHAHLYSDTYWGPFALSLDGRGLAQPLAAAPAASAARERPVRPAPILCVPCGPLKARQHLCDPVANIHVYAYIERYV